MRINSLSKKHKIYFLDTPNNNSQIVGSLIPCKIPTLYNLKHDSYQLIFNAKYKVIEIFDIWGTVIESDFCRFDECKMSMSVMVSKDVLITINNILTMNFKKYPDCAINIYIEKKLNSLHLQTYSTVSNGYFMFPCQEIKEYVPSKDKLRDSENKEQYLQGTKELETDLLRMRPDSPKTIVNSIMILYIKELVKMIPQVSEIVSSKGKTIVIDDKNEKRYEIEGQLFEHPTIKRICVCNKDFRHIKKTKKATYTVVIDNDFLYVDDFIIPIDIYEKQHAVCINDKVFLLPYYQISDEKIIGQKTQIEMFYKLILRNEFVSDDLELIQAARLFFTKNECENQIAWYTKNSSNISDEEIKLWTMILKDIS